MNKTTNKELEFTSVMPTMKKSLLALAIAGTMAMSGGANATLVSSSYLTIDDASATVEGDMTGTSPGTVLIDAPSAATLTSTTGNVAVDTITINETSGTSAIGLTAINTAAADGLAVTTGGDWGSANISTGTITLTGNANGAATGATSLTIADGHTINGAITAVAVNSSATSGNTTVTIQDGGTVKGTITLTSGDDANDGSILVLGSAGSSGATLTGAIVSTNALGTVTVSGDASVSGAIAATNADLKILTIATGKTLTASGTGAYAVLDTTLNGSGVLKLTGAKTLTGNIIGASSNTATFDIDANTTVDGIVGKTAAISAANVATEKTLTLINNTALHAVTNLTLTAGSSGTNTGLSFTTAAATLTGNIIGAAYTDLNIDQDVTIAGEVGKTTAITTGDVATSKTLILSGSATDITDLTLTGTAESNITGDQTFTGNIIGTSSDEVLNIDADVTIAGIVGKTAAVALADVATTKTLTLSGTTAANIDDLTLTGSGTLKITGAKTFTGAIVGAGSNTATLDIDADTTITGLVGKTVTLATANIADGTTLTLSKSGGTAHLITNLTLAAGSTAGSETTLKLTDTAGLTGIIIGGANTQLDVDASVTITGAVGSSTAITLADVATTKTLTLAGTAAAAIGDLTLTGSGILKITGAKTFTGAIVGAASNTATLDIDEDVTIAGEVGKTVALATGNVITGKTLTLSGTSGYNVTTTTLTADSNFKVTGAQTITGDIVGHATTTELDIDEDVTINGIVGKTAVIVAGNVIADKTLTLSGTGAYNVTDTTLSAGTASANRTTLKVSGAKTITGDIAGNAHTSLDIDANTTIAGIVGESTAITVGDVATATTLTLSTTGAAAVTDLTLTGSGTLKITGAKTFTGAIVGAASNTATLDIDEDVTIAGEVGKTVALATGNVITAKTLTLSGTDAAAITNLTLAGTGTLKITGNKTFTGNIIGTALNETLDIDANVTIAGEVGKTLAVAVANVADGKTLTSTGDYSVTATTLTEDDSVLIFNAAANQTVTGTINGADAAGEGDLTVSNNDGTTTFTSAIGGSFGLDAIALGSASTTVFDSTVEAASLDLAATAKVTVKAAVALTGELTSVTGTTITLGKAFKNGGATVFNTATDSTANFDSKTITVRMSNQFTTGTVVLLDNNATLDAADLAAFAETDNALVNYSIALSQVGAANDSLTITAVKRTAAGTASYLGMSSSQTAALGQVSAAVASGDATALAAVDTVLLTGGATAVNAVEQMNPDAGAATGSALAAVSGVNNVISSRQTNTRVAFNALGNQSGVSTGDHADDLVVWAQIFGSSATQDKVGTVDGYDADSSGLALGWESEKSGDLMGLSVSYSDSDVDGKSASASHTDTTAVQVSAYGTYGKATDWMVGYASGDNDTKRTVNFGGLALTASGKYDSNIFSAKVGHAFDSSNTGAWTMTPKVDASYTNIDNDGYTETGANNLNLVVASSSNDILTARAGAEFTQHIVEGGAVTIPHFNIMAGYDLTNDGGETSSTFTGGGSAFTTKGADPEKASLQLGFGVDHVSDDSTVSFDLNADLRSDYDSMSGSLTFKSKF